VGGGAYPVPKQKYTNAVVDCCCCGQYCLRNVLYEPRCRNGQCVRLLSVAEAGPRHVRREMARVRGSKYGRIWGGFEAPLALSYWIGEDVLDGEDMDTVQWGLSAGSGRWEVQCRRRLERVGRGSRPSEVKAASGRVGCWTVDDSAR
jgi:hypothetical protein